MAACSAGWAACGAACNLLGAECNLRATCCAAPPPSDRCAAPSLPQATRQTSGTDFARGSFDSVVRVTRRLARTLRHGSDEDDGTRRGPRTAAAAEFDQPTGCGVGAAPPGARNGFRGLECPPGRLPDP